MVYSYRYLDNHWHFKRGPISCDNLPILNLWPFECRLPYRSLTHLPCLPLSLCVPLPSPLAPSLLRFASILLSAPSSFPLRSPSFSQPANIFLLPPRFLVSRFSIDPQSDPEALFRITPDAGLITTAMELDREREHWHNITVIATQRGQGSHFVRRFTLNIRACPLDYIELKPLNETSVLPPLTPAPTDEHKAVRGLRKCKLSIVRSLESKEKSSV